MNILLVDDEECVIQDHRDALAKDGHQVQWVNTLAEALLVMDGSEQGPTANRFDLIVIDLMLGCDIPERLQSHFKTLVKCHLNEGQALGLWLWAEAGRRQRNDGPAHCYFSSVPQNYQLAVGQSTQEFAGMLNPGHGSASTGSQCNALIFSKWEVKPKLISETLVQASNLWARHYPVLSSATNTPL